MAHRKVNSAEHWENRESFLRHHLKIARICFFSHFFLPILPIHDIKASENIKFQFSGAI